MNNLMKPHDLENLIFKIINIIWLYVESILQLSFIEKKIMLKKLIEEYSKLIYLFLKQIFFLE